MVATVGEFLQSASAPVTLFAKLSRFSRLARHAARCLVKHVRCKYRYIWAFRHQWEEHLQKIVSEETRKEGDMSIATQSLILVNSAVVKQIAAAFFDLEVAKRLRVRFSPLPVSHWENHFFSEEVLRFRGVLPQEPNLSLKLKFDKQSILQRASSFLHATEDPKPNSKLKTNKTSPRKQSPRKSVSKSKKKRQTDPDSLLSPSQISGFELRPQLASGQTSDLQISKLRRQKSFALTEAIQKKHRISPKLRGMLIAVVFACRLAIAVEYRRRETKKTIMRKLQPKPRRVNKLVCRLEKPDFECIAAVLQKFLKQQKRD